MADLHYKDGDRIELGDNVWFSIDGVEHEGQLIKVFPRKGEARVSYRDPGMDRNKDGSLKRRVRIVPLGEIELAWREPC